MSIFSKGINLLESELDRRLNSYKPATTESQGAVLEKRMKDDGYGRKGLIFDPFTDTGYSGGLFKPKGAGSSFVPNHVLKLISRRDPIVSSILHVRSNQAATFCRLQSNRFDTGFKIKSRNATMEVNETEVKEIEEFIINCGRNEERSQEDKLTFDQFAYMIVWDMLVYGHCAIEKVKDLGGELYAFLPLPAETIYYANKKTLNKDAIQNTIESHRDAYKQTHGEEGTDFETPIVEDIEFVQVINNRVVEGFTQEELVLARIYLQTEIDLNGYAIGPLERALAMITAHLTIENHQKMYFTHGLASKGILVIQGDVTPNQLKTLQSQWTQQVTGPQAAWRTPVLGGIKGIQWQPLTMTNRDMEFAAYQDHVIRTIFSTMQMDPEEAGFGYLSKGQEQRSLSESSNEWKITASRDRGLRPLLARIEAIVNEEILPSWNPDYANKYQFCFVGLDAETRDEEISRLQSEVQLHTTLNEAREQADLEPLQVGGGLILNPTLISTVKESIPFGLWVEKFMGIPGASQRPDLQFFANPYWFQWQQMQMQIMQQQAQAQASAEAPPPEKPEATSDDPAERRNQQAQDQHEEATANHAQQQAQAQAQMIAIDQFIQANPDVFKSMQDNLKKAEVNTNFMEEMRGHLEKEFDRGAQILIKDVLDALVEDLESRKEDEKPKPGPKK